MGVNKSIFAKISCTNPVYHFQVNDFVACYAKSNARRNSILKLDKEALKIAVVVGNGSSRRLAPDAFGAVALDPSGGESLLECQRILMSEFGNFVDHSVSKKSVFIVCIFAYNFILQPTYLSSPNYNQ